MKSRYIVKLFKNHLGVLLTLLFLWIVFSISAPWFFTMYNIINILNHMTIVLILSMGMVFIIASGGIDLSVGSILGFTGIVIAMLLKAGIPNILVVLIGICVGASIGCFTGAVISRFKLQPFIVTLAMLSIVRGGALVLSGGQPIFGFPKSFTNFFAGTVGIPVNIYIMIFIIIIVSLLASKTKLGIYARSIGGSETSAILCGINTSKMKIILYSMQGAFAAIASCIFMSMMDTAEPLAGLQTEWLEAIAAPIIGGNSFLGGSLSIFGTVVGVLILSTIRSGLNVLGVQSFAQQLFIGLVIIISVVVDSMRQKSKL